MWFHAKIGQTAEERKELVRELIRKEKIRVGGNKNLKIYGTLDCTSGKRMKVKNRVFFYSVEEAKANGYRPCGYCMKKEYAEWKQIIRHEKAD